MQNFRFNRPLVGQCFQAIVRKKGVGEKSERGSSAAASNEGIGEEPSVSLSAGQTSFRESTSISVRAPLLFSHVREEGRVVARN